MRRRGERKASALSTCKARVVAVPIEGAARLVTLEDPQGDARMAQDCFARLQPPVDHPPHETASWRVQVAAVARAVRVLAPPRSAEPSKREEHEPASSVRDEAVALARREPRDEGLVSLVESILSQMERTSES